MAARQRNVLRALVLTLVTAGPAVPALAQGRAPVPDLALVTIEDLMNIEITSASRKEQRLADVPAAVYVITQEDIRRSGMTTVPELLRLVPGVQVARINSNKWAVSVRGFNGIFSNKLLVLVDGRSIYNVLNSGEFWESEDMRLEDIDRIEVIRGSGGAVWGANSLNGVINVVTKTAGATQGASVQLAAGSLDRAQVSARYGGAIGRTSYRVFTQLSDHRDTQLGARTSAADSWTSVLGGFRIDWAAGRDAVMIEGNVSQAQLHALWRVYDSPAPPIGGLARTSDSSDTMIANVLGRWTRTVRNGASVQVQAFVDARPRNEPIVRTHPLTTDIDLEYHATLGSRQDLVAGGGYRLTKENVTGSFQFFITPSQTEKAVANAFVQDEIRLGKVVHVTVGAKIEHDTFAGWGVQPTARILWEASKQQRVWAAVSRGLRTPSLNDRTVHISPAVVAGPGGLPVVIGLLGNADVQTEQVVSTEAGYRVNLGTEVTVDVTGFFSRYDGLQTNEALAPVLTLTPAPRHLFIATRYGNLLEAETQGVEIAAHWQATPSWRLEGSYTGFHLTPRLDATSRDATAASYDGSAPRHQGQLRSSVSLGPRVRLNAQLFVVGALDQLAVPAYLRADARVDVTLTPRLSVAVSGQNLSDRAHMEFAGLGTPVVTTLIPRSVIVQATWHP